MSRPRRAGRETAGDGISSGTASVANSTSQGKSRNSAAGGGQDKMGGLPLPDVVRELLREKSVLRWDFKDGVYEVLNGEEFERRFNDLRKVRNKVKAAGTERPFSRMYNFYVLEAGDKWAKSGTRFRPKCAAGQPTPEILSYIKSMDASPSSSSSSSPAKASPSAASSRSARALVTTAPSASTMASNSAPASSFKTSAPVPASPRISARAAPSHRMTSYDIDDLLSSRGTGAHAHHHSARASSAHHHHHSHSHSSTTLSSIAPSAHRHQPAMPPASVLGKRPASALDLPATGSLQDQIYAAFKQHGISQDPPRSRYPFGAPDAPGAGRDVEYRADAYRATSTDVAYSSHPSSHHQQPLERHMKAPVGSAGPYAHPADFSHVDVYNSDRSYGMPYEDPIEIDDASSGFPSPETIFGVEEEFTGSPLDLGEPELPLFSLDEDSREGTALRDHSLLSPFGCMMDPWESTSLVV